MVNIGRPSKGCLTCKRRRVKCDEARPVCSRCTKLKVECIYQDAWNSMIRHQEKWAEKKVTQRVEKVQLLRDAESGSGRHVGPRKRLPKEIPSITLGSQPQIQPEVYAINHFYIDYSFAPATCPFLYQVNSLYDARETASALHSALPAVALASAARRQNRHDLMQRATKYYGKTLRTLAKMTDVKIAKADATSLTIFMLGLYELISLGTDSAPSLRNPWAAHSSGRLSILRLRGPEQLATQAGRNLFVILYQEQLVSSLCSGEGVLEETTAWMRSTFPASPVVSMMLLMHDVSVLIKKVAIELERTPRPEDASELLETGFALDNMITDLKLLFLTGETQKSITMKLYAPIASPSSTIPWQFMHGPNSSQDSQRLRASRQEFTSATQSSTPPPSPLQCADVPEEIKRYLSTTRALATNMLRATHIRLLTELSKLLWHLLAKNIPIPTDVHFVALQEEWNTEIARSADEICEEVPYALGDLDHLGRTPKDLPRGVAFRAHVSLFPIETAIKASQTSLKSKRQLARRLKSIATDVGIGMADYIFPADLRDCEQIPQGDTPHAPDADPPEPYTRVAGVHEQRLDGWIRLWLPWDRHFGELYFCRHGA